MDAMLTRRILSYTADALSVGYGIVAGLLTAWYFHQQWYYGGWMSAFGDCAVNNSAYSTLAPLFQAAPCYTGGLVCGLICGFGSPRPVGILIRAIGPIMFLIALYPDDSALSQQGLEWNTFKAFMASVVVSFCYHWLLGIPNRKPKTNGSNFI
jgi:hypothetical protein